MGMETTDKLCYNCIHYLHGQLENPCAKGMSKVGYLQPGCWRWESENGKGIEMTTKKCSICGEVKEIEKFGITKGRYNHYCKACRKIYKESRKRKKKE